MSHFIRETKSKTSENICWDESDKGVRFDEDSRSHSQAKDGTHEDDSLSVVGHDGLDSLVRQLVLLLQNPPVLL